MPHATVLHLLYGHETWALTLWEGHKQRRGTWNCRRDLGPRWKSKDHRKKMHEELHDLYCSPNIPGVIRSRYVTLMDNVAYWSDQIKVRHTDGQCGILE